METTLHQTYVDGVIREQEQKAPRERVWRIDTRAFGGHINIDDEWEAHIWCRRFGCSAQQLRDAIKIKGTSANALRRHFEMKEHGAF